MSHELEPKVGRWYRNLDEEELFKVVSIDEDDGLIEIKTTDGEVEELDLSEWIELDLDTAEAPEDYVDPDEDDEDDEDERPARKGGTREGWDDDDEDDDDWDEDDDDEDGDDDYDSDR